MDHKIFHFHETVVMSADESDPQDYDRVISTHELQVSTRKLEAWIAENEGEYRYVQRLIEEALAGKTDLTASRKYSFGDTPDWFTGLAPDVDCKDPVVQVDIEIRVC